MSASARTHTHTHNRERHTHKCRQPLQGLNTATLAMQIGRGIQAVCATASSRPHAKLPTINGRNSHTQCSRTRDRPPHLNLSTNDTAGPSASSCTHRRQHKSTPAACARHMRFNEDARARPRVVSCTRSSVHIDTCTNNTMQHRVAFTPQRRRCCQGRRLPCTQARTSASHCTTSQ
jgi:hypothetical protein